jgi:hypothetical protein
MGLGLILDLLVIGLLGFLIIKSIIYVIKIKRFEKKVRRKKNEKEN